MKYVSKMDCENHLLVPKTPKENKEEPLECSAVYLALKIYLGMFLFNIPCKAEKIILRNASMKPKKKNGYSNFGEL